jgi:thiol:disulfide interchange protein DsbC
MYLNQRVRNLLRSVVPVAASAALAAIPSAVIAATATATVKPEVTAAIRQSLESRFPGTHVLDVAPSIIPDLYEVFVGDQIIYSDAAGDHVLVGALVDTKTKENLTDASMNERGKIDFKTLPLSQAIKVVKGNGSRTFAVFSDPDCPYCQQLEKTLLTVNDFTMYVFLFPITSLHPQSAQKAHAIWCAPDHVQAWSSWMHEKKLPEQKTCSGDPVDALQKLGDTLHINSTPTLFFANGHRIAGALPGQELEKALNASSAPPGAAQQHTPPPK